MAKQAYRKSTNPIAGIINVTGEPDSGKTVFAFTSGAVPERTAFYDDDVKGNAIVQDIKDSGRTLGIYHNLVRETDGMRELDLHKYCMSLLDEIEAGQIDVLIWDTWTRFENTFQPVVHANPTKFKQFYSPMGAIKGSEEWNASFHYESSVLAKMAELVPLVILTSHLKNNMQKVAVAESKKPLIQKSRMRVWLRHNPSSPEPVGLFLKRLSKMDFDSGSMKPINVTHRKMTPCTWERLIYYWNNPVGNSKPSPEEELNEFEVSILDGVLTRDQKNILELARIEAEREQKEEEKNNRMMNTMVKRGVPVDGMELISKAFDQLDLGIDEISEITGISEDDLITLEGEEVQHAWTKLQNEADSVGIARIEKAEAQRKKGSAESGKGRTGNNHKSSSRGNKSKR
jgi:hypothetical protein